ncbi:hypothetical protein NDU88_008240 [Pleurodeles waltl]|uniref:Uncharacterized protein n=1 Tax=Pleurodeles waltl TaxID=8319 RepID=A0AAV7VT31_PLEWA|nr:hypothetical protein NDU88_008240 [Pleurodeles waltl]
MGNDRSNKGAQQTRMDQYTAQSAGESLQKDSPGPTDKGGEPNGAQILAAIEASRQAVQTMVQLQRQSYIGVKQKLKEFSYTYMLLYPAKFKVLHAGPVHFFQMPEAVWDWLELRTGEESPGIQCRGSLGGDPRRGDLQATAHRNNRCRSRRNRVSVRPDGTLSLARKRQEREGARL